MTRPTFTLARHVLPSLALLAVLGLGCSRPDDHDHAVADSDPHGAHNHDHGHGHDHGAAHADHREPPAGAAATDGSWCAEHGVPEEECGICRSNLASTLKPGESLKVRLPSSDSADLAGVRVAQPASGTLTEAVECYAEIAHDQNKLAQIAAPVGGIIQEVHTDLGATVTEGQTVARIWSAAIAEAVARAFLTHQTLDRERRLRSARVTSERDLQEAEATHRAACQQLHTLGFTEEQIDELGARPQESVLLDVRAPFAGEIIDRLAVRGALVESGKPLFTVVDRTVVWAMLNLREADLARVRTGQSVELHVDSLPDRTFIGKLNWIGPEVDIHTRMARARAEIPNPDGLLRARMFARARILGGTRDGALLVPASAIQQVEGNPLVFVRLAPDLYEARAVRLGARDAGFREIASGLGPHEIVAVDHVFSLKAQLLLSRLGAGCAHE